MLTFARSRYTPSAGCPLLAGLPACGYARGVKPRLVRLPSRLPFGRISGMGPSPVTVAGAAVLWWHIPSSPAEQIRQGPTYSPLRNRAVLCQDWPSREGART